MSEQRFFDISFMQADCLYRYSRGAGKTIQDSVADFCKYHIPEYINTCFEDLHLYGIDAVISDISARIREGVDFVK